MLKLSKRCLSFLSSPEHKPHFFSFFLCLSPCSHPSVLVDKELLKQKLSAPTTMAKVKGVYDLLVTRDVQADRSARGTGSHPCIDPAILEAMIRETLISFPTSSSFPQLGFFLLVFALFVLLCLGQKISLASSSTGT